MVNGHLHDEQIPDRFDGLLRSVTSHTLWIKPLSDARKDKLTLVEIGVAGLDCKACCLAAYESLRRSLHS